MIVRQIDADERETVPVSADPVRKFQEQRARADVIAALLREREGYVARGLSDRVAQVDAELARVGHTSGMPVDVPSEAEYKAALAREREARDREAERQAQISALLDERGKCERAGRDDHIPAVDAELRRLGYEAPPAAKKSRRLGVKR